MTLTGTISKHSRPNNGGTFYQLTTEGGVELSISMTESTKAADDAAVLEPLIGKKVEADGIVRVKMSQMLAYTVKAA